MIISEQIKEVDTTILSFLDNLGGPLSDKEQFQIVTLLKKRKQLEYKELFK